MDERGIETDPDKIHAIIEKKSPGTIKEVQRLTGYMAAVGRFMSRVADKNLYFFRMLKQSTFDWDDATKEAFQQLKSH